MAHIIGTFCERELLPKSVFDRRSFRWTRRGKNWLLTGCRAGDWNAKGRGKRKCKTGLRAHALLTPQRGGRCKIGAKRIAKG